MAEELARVRRANRISFPAADDSHRAARMRCAIACRNYNAQPEDILPEERARLWRAIVSPRHEFQLSSSPRLFDQGDPDAEDSALVDSHDEVDRSAKADVRNNFNVSEEYPGDALTSHSSCHKIYQNDDPTRTAESRLDSTTPTPPTLHSPPPSPGVPRLPPSLSLSRGEFVEYDPTPPPSRRTSHPSVLVRETPPLDEKDPLPQESLSMNFSSVKSKLSNPFVSGVPYVKPPIYVDYGCTLKISSSTFVNRNFTVLDSPAVDYTIGERCLIGPNVTLAGIGHPLNATERAGPLGAPSLAAGISIEDDCWIGAGVTILGGVNIGSGCVIGAGAIVTRSIPANYLAVGVPARIIRRVTSPPHECHDCSTVSCQNVVHKERVPSQTHAAQRSTIGGGVVHAFDCSRHDVELAGLQDKVKHIECRLWTLGLLIASVALLCVWRR